MDLILFATPHRCQTLIRRTSLAIEDLVIPGRLTINLIEENNAGLTGLRFVEEKS